MMQDHYLPTYLSTYLPTYLPTYLQMHVYLLSFDNSPSVTIGFRFNWLPTALADEAVQQVQAIINKGW